MPLTEKGQKILKSMTSTYGSAEKAKKVFYASANAGTIKNVHECMDKFAKNLLRRTRK